jgi:UDP-N-acetylmuramoylalanine--D-glutamate ligase
MIKNFQGKQVLIIGAARQGLALSSFLVKQGAHVLVNDMRPSNQLQSVKSKMDQIASDFPGTLRWSLGEHSVNLLENINLVSISGGVPLDLPLVQEALRRKIVITNDTQIFMESVPCPVVGITGSAGKTTTTTLVGQIAPAVFQDHFRKVWVGGNIGLPLIDELDAITSDDLVILELSSFQLEIMTRAPEISAVLNVTPNHLDRHGTLEAYTAAKSNILEHQEIDGISVLCHDDPGSWALKEKIQGKMISFGVNPPPDNQSGAYMDPVSGEFIQLRDGQKKWNILPVQDIHLKGKHNLKNVLAGCAIIFAIYKYKILNTENGQPALSWESLPPFSDGIKNFNGIPHRLELVRTYKNIAWYNDSIATAPERTIAAIHSFDEPLVLLLGGRDKDLPWQSLADIVCQRVDHVVTFGEAGDLIYKTISAKKHGANERPYTLTNCLTLSDAVEEAGDIAEAGDVVLLSPGGTSYDEFKDFEQRGKDFRRWVHSLS